MAESKRAVCLVIDGLQAGQLSCYGNTWIHTPTCDRLASESFVLDQAFAAGLTLADAYRAMWLGLAWADPSSHSQVPPALPAALTAAGYRAVLVTDEQALHELPGAAQFSETIRIESPEPAQAVDEIADSHFAHLFAVAAEAWESLPDRGLLWVHSRGLAGPWDAPAELRNEYRDEEDPPLPDLVQPPAEWLPKDVDPDYVLGILHCYAGQVALLDACLEQFLEIVCGSDESPPSVFLLLAARGFSLGEHGRIGFRRDALYGEMIQVPWFIRLADGAGRLGRSQGLVHQADLPATLLDLLDIPGGPATGGGRSLVPLIRSEQEALRDRLFFQGDDHERAMRTAAWHFRQRRMPRGGSPERTGLADEPSEGSGEGSVQAAPAEELFAKPDDRWEVNDVAGRCPQVVEEFEQAIERAELVARRGEEDTSPLPDVLTEGLG